MTLRNWRSASSMPAAVQRRHISPEDQRFTLRDERRTHSIMDSQGFVEERVALSAPETPRRFTVSVSASPSRSDAAAPGCERSSSHARASRRSWAVSWSASAHAERNLRLTVGRSRSGRCSATLRSLCLTQRWTGVWTPSTSRTALRSALAPSSTQSTPWEVSRPRSTRSASSPVATAAVSAEPSQRPSGILTPSVVIPSATTFVRPLSSIPSIISTARRTSSRRRPISAARFSAVRATNSRLTADFEVERDSCSSSSPTGSWVRAKRRVETPASIRSSTTSASGSRAAKWRTSRAPPRARRRLTAPLRAPSVTELCSCPWRFAVRSRTCFPFGPTTSETSAAISSWSTPSPTPTESAMSPSFAAPASSPRASCTRSGNSARAPSSGVATCADDTLLMAVPPVLVVDFDHPARSHWERTRREDRRLQVLRAMGHAPYLAASDMLRCVRTGEPAAETVFGMPFFEYLATDAQASDVFNRAMAGGAAARASVALEYDWSDASVVADIGGGTGSLLGSVLGAQPHLRGVVFDLPHVAAEARPVIEAAGLSDRCETAGGDFFTEPLPSADVYVLAQILHDWDDERAMAILRNCRRSIAEGGRVLVVEQVLPEGDEPSYGKLIDLIMLTLLGGKERTEAEWRTLLREGGFELIGVTTGAAASLLEAAPAGPGTPAFARR